MEDAALIYRITRAPEKRVFTIPVGNIPTPEIESYIESIARQFKKKQFFDPSTGDVNERWHPLIQEDDFWLPQRADGTGPTITTLPGAENLDDIKDIEYFKKNMVSALKIPFDRVGLGESPSTEERSLAAVDPTFAKEVQWIQREVAVGLKKIAMVHLALAGFKEQDLRGFDIHMTASSAIDELYRIETWQSRANVIDALRATEMFPKKWILKRFTNMTDDEIEEMEEEQKEAQAQMPQMGMEGMGGGMPGMEGGAPMGEGLPPGEPVPLDMGMPGEMPPPPGGAPLPEDYNADLEQELLMEQKRYEEFAQKPIKEEKIFISNGLYDNFTTSKEMLENTKLNNGFSKLLNNCELDGLAKFDEDEKEQVIIESFLPEEDVEEAKKVARTLLTEGEPEVEMLDDIITPRDLPARGVFLD